MGSRLMPWFHVDDGFSNSKPVMRIPRRYRPVCIGVWTLTGAWSAKELTDGFIPHAVLEEYGATSRVVELLVDADLWELTDSGINFRNWAKWQRTKRQVLDYRSAEADRKRNWRNGKKQSPDQQESEASAECPAGTHTGVPYGVPYGVRDVSALPIPIPKPEPKEEQKDLASQAPPADKRGQRIPEDWNPSEATKLWAAEHYGHLDLRAEWTAFVNYWRGESGQRARKLDWNAAFKNWLHNARAPARLGQTPGPPPATRKVNAGLQLAAKLAQDTPELEA